LDLSGSKDASMRSQLCGKVKLADCQKREPARARSSELAAQLTVRDSGRRVHQDALRPDLCPNSGLLVDWLLSNQLHRCITVADLV
jgi:hypothetical protein